MKLLIAATLLADDFPDGKLMGAKRLSVFTAPEGGSTKDIREAVAHAEILCTPNYVQVGQNQDAVDQAMIADLVMEFRRKLEDAVRAQRLAPAPVHVGVPLGTLPCAMYRASK